MTNLSDLERQHQEWLKQKAETTRDPNFVTVREFAETYYMALSEYLENNVAEGFHHKVDLAAHATVFSEVLYTTLSNFL